MVKKIENNICQKRLNNYGTITDWKTGHSQWCKLGWAFGLAVKTLMVHTRGPGFRSSAPTWIIASF